MSDDPLICSLLDRFLDDVAAREHSLQRGLRSIQAPIAEQRTGLGEVAVGRGKLDEAEQIQRQDLPPQMANNNLAYLRAASGK